MTLNITQAAKELLSRRVAGTKAPRLAEDIRPTDLEQAIEIQKEMMTQNPAGVGGWKCLLPFDDKVIVGPIFADTVQRGDICKLFADNGVARIEPEIAFVLKADLPAKEEDYTEAEIEAAIGSTHMALELMQSRFAEDSEAEFPERLADIMLNQGLYIGPEISREAAYKAANIQLSFTQNGETRELDGVHPNPLPQLPVYWLINYMSKRGVSFKAGEGIITGSYKGIVEVDFDTETHIKYEGLGEYKVTFKAL